MISLTKQFVKEMEKRILTGELPIGEKIPPLRVLAEEFHVSRSVINAGIVELCNDGYLLTVPRKYICVSDWRKTGNFAMLNGLIDNGLCDDDFFDDMLAGRMTIEKAIAREAALTRTEQDLEEIRKIIVTERHFCNEYELVVNGEDTNDEIQSENGEFKGMESYITLENAAKTEESYIEKRVTADKDFHHALAVAAHNIVYTVILNSFHTLENQLVQEFYEKEIDYGFVVELHEQLYEAMKNQNVDEAERLMEKLLIHGEMELRK